MARVLKPDGTFLTQQVGGLDCIELCEALGSVRTQHLPSLDDCAQQIASGGLEIVDAREAFSAKTFLDIGAILYYVLAIPWAFVGFSLETHRDTLREIHERTVRDGGFTVHEHRLLFEARKP